MKRYFKSLESQKIQKDKLAAKRKQQQRRKKHQQLVTPEVKSLAELDSLAFRLSVKNQEK